MIATVVEAEAILMNEANAVTPMIAVTTPMSAEMMGSPAATNAPNVTIRIRNATMMPMSSGSSDSGSCDPGYTDPA